MYEYSFLVRDGGLMSSGPDLKETVEPAAAMVDRIFQGARPADLPFEEPTHYRFALIFCLLKLPEQTLIRRATFTGAINGGSANVKVPFSTHGFTQSDTFQGSFVFDNQLVPSSGSGFVNVFISSSPDIANIPGATAFNFNLDGLAFNAGNNLDSLRPFGIQYSNGQFNGFVFITDFTFVDGSIPTSH
jgi:hypothetical protein